MTPKERICAIRLFEKMKYYSEFFGKIGVEIDFVDHFAEQTESAPINPEIV